MKLIRTIRDTDLGLHTVTPLAFDERRAARAVIFDTQKLITLLHVTKKGYHKLPGGGIEHGEDMLTALRRELLEEVGCSAENIRELGSIEEFRNEWKEGSGNGLHQISYCFIAEVSGEKGTPHLEAEEITDGFETEWLTLEEAIRTLQNELSVDDDEGKFITLRDRTFLEAARHMQSNAPHLL